ncbi:hypothetical protein Ga0609869_003609 [Rhodovulum iodosum]|uniref:Uncharacterized protein n=1 Tax=Rhodovulum iodosum TaxID=68291 RepID=A0ABV3XY16_9RHOB
MSVAAAFSGDAEKKSFIFNALNAARFACETGRDKTGGGGAHGQA